MRNIKTLLLTLAFALALPLVADAKIPWGTINIQTSATPTCTTFATSPVCILNMTANITTGVVLTGGAKGSNATLIMMQDGTGSRTIVWPTNVTAASYLNGGAIPAITTAANSYTVFVLQATATNTYSIVDAEDNPSLNDTFYTTQTVGQVNVAPGAYALQATIVVPGATIANTCVCQPQTIPATWQTGLALGCLPLTNAVQCVEINGVGQGTAVPTAITVNVHLGLPI